MADFAAQMRALQDSIDRLHGDLGRVHRDLEDARRKLAEVGALSVETGRDARRASEIGRHLFDQEVENRRRLQALRRSDQYELAFTEPEPLVSYVVPTFTSHETLRDVALPSILGQSYSNLEVIVVGDAAPEETERAIVEIADSRVSYFNRTVRGPYPKDAGKRWYVAGTPPFNEGLARARGHWIACLGDDDAVRPNHAELLLATARERHVEHCYGRIQINFGIGEPVTIGAFPPVEGHWVLQSTIFHAGLRFIEQELSDSIYDEPNDWSVCRRMLRAGVSFAMVDEVVADKHESRQRSAEEWRRSLTVSPRS